MKIPEIIDRWVNEHFSHVTPGTPDHAVLSRATADLKEKLEPTPKPQEQTIKQNTKGE